MLNTTLRLSKQFDDSNEAPIISLSIACVGVAMGAPLAPVIADIFMTHLETILMDKLTQLGVCEWYRYVDDTFVLLNKDTNVDNILSVLNDFHSSIQFTRKIEDSDKLEFLDVQVIRSLEKQCFETTIYRKPTFTGLLTNWNSYVPIHYKKAGIVSMINCALNICSTYKLLEDEFNEIRRFGLDNDYPLSFINTMIGIKLSHHRNKINKKLEQPIIENDKKKMYVEIPFISSSSSTLQNKIKHLTNKLRPDLDIQFFFKPPPPVQVHFQTKDPIAKHMQSNVVYYIKCNDCEHSYIGKTERQCVRRHYEHGAPTLKEKKEYCRTFLWFCSSCRTFSSSV
ncbi:unnamed protein product [Rotaria sp. Silwood2]|nr:unnamed protein product [Rotaria sp. Silwood2]